MLKFCLLIQRHTNHSKLQSNQRVNDKTLLIVFGISSTGMLEVQSMLSRREIVQFSSVSQLCPTLCDTTDCSTPGFPVHHQLPESTQTHTIQPSHPLSSPSPPTFNLSQHQGLFQWVGSSHEVAIVLEFQLKHQSFQRIFRTDFL